MCSLEPIECFGIPEDDNSVCSSHGKCYKKDKCFCQNGWIGLKCDQIPIECFGTLSTTKSVCNNKGKCVRKDVCECNEGWTGKECEIPYCYGTLANKPNVCCGKGTCKKPDDCKCDSGYFGEKCCDFKCFRYYSTDKNACSGHGKCIDADTCECQSGYDGKKCEKYNCYGHGKNDVKVCSGHGKCAGADKCKCEEGYLGDECENWKCYGYYYNDPKVCNGHECVGPDQCKCSKGFGYCDVSGRECEKKSKCYVNIEDHDGLQTVDKFVKELSNEFGVELEQDSKRGFPVFKFYFHSNLISRMKGNNPKFKTFFDRNKNKDLVNVVQVSTSKCVCKNNCEVRPIVDELRQKRMVREVFSVLYDTGKKEYLQNCNVNTNSFKSISDILKNNL